MKFKILLVLFIIQISLAQQRTCGTYDYMENVMSNPELRQQYNDLERQFQSELQRLAIAQQTKNGQVANNTNTTIRVPVAVHYPSVTATSSNASLRSCLTLLAQRQVNILNADYNAQNADLSNWAADEPFYTDTNTTFGVMDVSFEIATQNHPAGSGLGFPTNGNPAVTFGTDFLSNADTDTTWAGYCNLVVRNISGGILGYSPLGGSPSAGMTVVIDNNAFGATMTGSPATCTGYVPGAPYNLGRTLTHELGHFFNLDHTFASCDGSNCATSGDKVCDTPSADTPWFTCDPTGSVFTNCGTTQLTMNYMDYVEDSCMYMFTAGQATRMTAWYNTISSQLHMNTLSNEDFSITNFAISPNPNNGSFTIQNNKLMDNYSIHVFDSMGRNVFEENYSQMSSLSQTIKLENVSAGVYYVNIKTGNGVGTTKKIIIN